MTIEISLLISGVSVCFAIYFGLRNNKRSDVKEIEQRVRERTETNMKLDNIGKCVAEIKDNISDTKRDLQEVKEKLFLVEQREVLRKIEIAKTFGSVVIFPLYLHHFERFWFAIHDQMA